MAEQMKQIKKFVDLGREEPFMIGTSEHRGVPNFTIRHTWFPNGSDEPAPTKKGIVVAQTDFPQMIEEMLKVFNESTGSNWTLVEMGDADVS